MLEIKDQNNITLSCKVLLPSEATFEFDIWSTIRQGVCFVLLLIKVTKLSCVVLFQVSDAAAHL